MARAADVHDLRRPAGVAGVGRLGTIAAWISAVCCLPYLILKIAWTVGVPVGVTDPSVLDSTTWVAGNALMAVVQLTGLLLVVALTRPWARRLPAWLVLVPAWVGIGLLFQVTVGAVLVGLFSPPAQASGGASTGPIQPWVFVLVYASFAGQGVALAIAFACHVRARWGALLGERTGEVVARRTGRMRSWPEDHVTGMAKAVAVMTVALAVLFAWGVVGSFGISGEQPGPSWGMQASRATGAVLAAVGLLGLAGSWGQRTRFWLPVALVWVGSGALAAFDGLTLAVNRLFLVFGTGAGVPAWSTTDTVLVIKVALGVAAAAVGALAVAAAADEGPRGSGPPTGRSSWPAP